ncbi:MAG: class II aldolase/adducin family protein [Bacteroidota bacterium]
MDDSVLTDLNKWRQKLYSLKLIGAYDNGIGFGNLSRLESSGQFIISGSATGNLKTLDSRHYAKVVDYNIHRNDLTCEGPIKASSESLTHASIYENDLSAYAVVHVHDMDLWNRLKYVVPTTNENVSYGTPEMAKEIGRLFLQTDVKEKKIVAMAGHEEGIISFGKDLNEACEVLLRYFNG